MATNKRDVVTVGVDPEYFLVNSEGKLVSAIGKFGGTKLEPKKFSNGWVQEDNVAVEFNIKETSSIDTFDKRIAEMIEAVGKYAKKHYDCTLAYGPSGKFDSRELAHPSAQQMGCDPDFNAWTLRQNKSPSAVELAGLRTTSGHVHVGHPYLTEYGIHATLMIRLLDIYLGFPMLVIATPNTFLRRKYYGAAGAYRPKTYGVEYRVLDNTWTRSKVMRNLVFKQVNNAFSMLTSQSPAQVELWVDRMEKDYGITRAINEDLYTTSEIIRTCDRLCHVPDGYLNAIIKEEKERVAKAAKTMEQTNGK